MSQEKFNKNDYDVISISRTGSDKKANYVQDANHISKQQKTSGQFIKVFADVFLKREATPKSYV